MICVLQNRTQISGRTDKKAENTRIGSTAARRDPSWRFVHPFAVSVRASGDCHRSIPALSLLLRGAIAPKMYDRCNAPVIGPGTVGIAACCRATQLIGDC